MNTIYLKFNTIEECEAALVGFIFSEYKDHVFKGSAFGTVFMVSGSTDIYVNIYDYEGVEFNAIKLPPPVTPYNERA
jgi:hypothetical protein